MSKVWYIVKGWKVMFGPTFLKGWRLKKIENKC